MSITVKFFAGLREQSGCGEVTFELTRADMTVGDVWQQLSQVNEMLPANVLSAINLEYARADDIVSQGDEVAFFPPVTGG